jgi:hypothetical protein
MVAFMVEFLALEFVICSASKTEHRYPRTLNLQYPNLPTDTLDYSVWNLQLLETINRQDRGLADGRLASLLLQPQ